MNTIPAWKLHTALWGTIAFFLTFSIIEKTKAYIEIPLYDIAGGYMLGFISAFSLYVIHKIYKTRGGFLGNTIYSKVFSVLAIVPMLIFGIAGYYVEFFGDKPPHFVVAFATSCAFVKYILIPVIENIDRGQTFK